LEEPAPRQVRAVEKGTVTVWVLLQQAIEFALFAHDALLVQ
jgi:hypothetical protein